jgi:hypothetical protein
MGQSKQNKYQPFCTLLGKCIMTIYRTPKKTPSFGGFLSIFFSGVNPPNLGGGVKKTLLLGVDGGEFAVMYHKISLSVFFFLLCVY